MAADRMTVSKLHDLLKELSSQQELNFKNLSTDLLLMKDQIISNLIESNKNLQKKVEKLENDLEMAKTDIECNNQYVRRNNMEITGIPNEIEDEKLEEKVVDILKQSEILEELESDDIEACHRLPPTRRNSNKKVIVRFVNRKKVEKCLKLKKNLSDLNMESVDLPSSTKLYISPNLNRHFQKLSWHCRRLKKENLISSFKYQNETFVINLGSHERKNIKKINSELQLIELFPEFFQ